MSVSVGNRLRGADGLRTIACLLVLWHHISQRLNPDQSPRWLQIIHYAGMRGEVGVSLFFVLSGALLSYPFWRNFLDGKKSPDIRRYVRNRIARIAPAMWFNLLFVTLIASVVYDIPTNFARLLQGLTFTNSYFYTTFFPADLNGPLWSIGLEVSCYILLPFVLLSVIKSARNFSSAVIAMLVWMGALLLINPWIINTFMTGNEGKGWNNGLVGGAKQWLPYWNINSFFTQFLCGSLAALLVAKVAQSGPSKRYDVLAIASLIAAAVIVWTRVNPGSPDALTHQAYASPFYSALMAMALFGAASGTYLWKILDNRAFTYLASISFGIYLWHHFILTIMEKSFTTDFGYYGIHDPIRWAKLALIDIVLSIAIAAVSWKFFEKPILDKVRRRK